MSLIRNGYAVSARGAPSRLPHTDALRILLTSREPCLAKSDIKSNLRHRRCGRSSAMSRKISSP
jgi:hypothetical protein